MFSTRLDKQDEDDQVLDKIEPYNILKINQKLAQSDIAFMDVQSQLEMQTQNHRTKDNG